MVEVRVWPGTAYPLGPRLTGAAPISPCSPSAVPLRTPNDEANRLLSSESYGSRANGH